MYVCICAMLLLVVICAGSIGNTFMSLFDNVLYKKCHEGYTSLWLLLLTRTCVIFHQRSLYTASPNVLRKHSHTNTLLSIYILVLPKLSKYVIRLFSYVQPSNHCDGISVKTSLEIGSLGAKGRKLPYVSIATYLHLGVHPQCGSPLWRTPSVFTLPHVVSPPMCTTLSH